MKILMFTPAIKPSAIGRMCSLVTRALVRKGHEVFLVRTENEKLLEGDTHDFGCELLPWNDAERVQSLAAQADLLVYQMGNNHEYHFGCMVWLPQLLGILCMHDFFLGHLFWSWSEKRREEAEKLLRAWYGETIAQHYFNFSSTEAFIEGTRHEAPMTEWVCSMALGVVTHSNWGAQRALDSCPGPVFVVPLAYDAPGHIEGNRPPAKEALNILTIGHVNPNKRVDSVIRAIGQSPALRAHASYRVVGSIAPETITALEALAAEQRVRLTLSGQVDNKTLAQAIDEADVVSCLRWPALEAASASAIEAILYGKATIVTDTGFYGELPDDVVVKIDPGDEIASLQSALERLQSSPKRRDHLGRTAKAWASATFTGDNYADKLLEIGRAATKTQPLRDMIEQFTDQLCAWGASEQVLALRETTDPLRLFNHCGARKPTSR